MKLNKFQGKKINEYLDVEIDFNNDLTILTGINGSGKTTSLNLIQAILLPKIQDLLIIPFEELILDFEHHKNEYSINVFKNKEFISFNVVSSSMLQVVTPLFIPLDIISEFDLYKIQAGENKKMSYLNQKFKNEDYIKFLDNISKPILIGLERTSNDVNDEYKNYLYERNMFLRKDISKKEHYLSKSNLGVSTLDTEMLVQNVYKRVKEIRDNYFKVINKELITSSFDFVEFNVEDFRNNSVDIKEKFKILEKKDEIEETLKSIGFLDAELSKKLRLFFEKIETVLRKMDGKDDSIVLEWILNRSQIDKLHTVLNLIDDYNSKANKIFEPVNKFLSIINSFLKDSGKRILIDSVGRLFIAKPQGRNLTIDELSSGERQLVVLFANVIFNKYNASRKPMSDILIIDEPEISLHIRWQENFINLLLQASPVTQFIIATHSPDIIGDYKHKTKRVLKK